MNRRALSLLMGAALVVTLVGCAGRALPGEGPATPLAESSAAPSQPPSAQSSAPAAPIAASSAPAAPAPSPTETATEGPDAAPPENAALLSSEGLGPLRVRSPVPPGQSLVTWNPHACFPDDDFGAWDADRTYPADGGLAEPSFSVWADGGKADNIRYIAVSDPAITTRHGLHVESSLDEVRALGAVDAGPDRYTDRYEAWVIRGSIGELVAWVEGGTVQLLVVEKRDTRHPFFLWEGYCE